MSSAARLEIIGLMSKHAFQMAKSVAEGLRSEFPDSFEEPQVRPLMECDWDAYLSDKKREMRGEAWQYRGSLMCFADGRLIGDELQFSSWAEAEWSFTLHRPRELHVALAEEYYRENLRRTGHEFVYMDVAIGGEAVGRLLFELFSDLCPKTSRNFRSLCTGEAGPSQSQLELSYQGSIFHRVVPNGWVQGGDISPAQKGTGGESIYGPTFEDENFVVSHNKRGILGMANKGPNSNGSQFYIALQPAPWMDQTYVAFGRLVEGTQVLQRLEDVPTNNDRPVAECKVLACGVFDPGVTEDKDKTPDNTEAD